jgi:imidazolonepropionase-like amidohydrolase
MALEMQILNRAGFSNYEVLQAATEVAGRVLRQPNLGKIEPGATADIVLLAHNPLDDLGTLDKPLLTIKSGKIVTTV